MRQTAKTAPATAIPIFVDFERLLPASVVDSSLVPGLEAEVEGELEPEVEEEIDATVWVGVEDWVEEDALGRALETQSAVLLFD